ncbi:MAG: hypothetical protein ACLT0Y_03415 [Christensenellales bacterium]
MGDDGGFAITPFSPCVLVLVEPTYKALLFVLRFETYWNVLCLVTVHFTFNGDCDSTKTSLHPAPKRRWCCRK